MNFSSKVRGNDSKNSLIDKLIRNTMGNAVGGSSQLSNHVQKHQAQKSNNMESLQNLLT